MIRSIAVALVGGVTLVLASTALAQSPAVNQSASAAQPSSPQPAAETQPQMPPGDDAELKAADPTASLPGLPPLPSAKSSTIFGGAIRKIDPVRDQFMLDIYGQRPMKVLFDERTQLYRDGVKIPVHDLGPADHASVQTALDGTRIFAMSVHILSSIPQGQYRGRVLRFDDSTGELRLDAYPSSQPFVVRVPADVPIVREGQSAFTKEGGSRGDLRPGALVHVTFKSGVGSIGVASQVQVLAVPGASFIFSGNIATLDVGTGSLTLTDPRDQKSYRISFTPSAFPLVQNLHIGQHVRVTADFNGSSYLATDITAY